MAGSKSNESSTNVANVSEYLMDAIILGPRKFDGKFWVQWKNYSAKQNTWEPPENLCARDIQDYLVTPLMLYSVIYT